MLVDLSRTSRPVPPLDTEPLRCQDAKSVCLPFRDRSGGFVGCHWPLVENRCVRIIPGRLALAYRPASLGDTSRSRLCLGYICRCCDIPSAAKADSLGFIQPS